MEISQLLDEAGVHTRLRVASLPALIKRVQLEAQALPLDISEVKHALGRENWLMDAYLYDGLAIVPVPVSADLLKAHFFMLSRPLPLGANDHVPTSMLLMLYYPEHEAAIRLRAMAMLSRLLRSKDLRTRLLGVADPASAYVLLMQPGGDKAA